MLIGGQDLTNYSLQHLTHSFSDHCPLLLNTQSRVTAKKDWNEFPFRFNADWILESDFEDRLKVAWQECDKNLPQKLVWLGQKLKEWDNDTKQRRKQRKSDLSFQLQQLNEDDLDEEVLEEIMNVKLALNMEADREEIYWEQRAKQN